MIFLQNMIPFVILHIKIEVKLNYRKININSLRDILYYLTHFNINVKYVANYSFFGNFI